MNERGEIRRFLTVEEAKAAGFHFNLSDGEAHRLERLPESERVAELERLASSGTLTHIAKKPNRRERRAQKAASRASAAMPARRFKVRR